MKSLFLTKISTWLFAFTLATAYSNAQLTPEESARIVFESHEIYLHEYANFGFSSTFPYNAYPPSATQAVEARLVIAEEDLGVFFDRTYQIPDVGATMEVYYQQYDLFATEFIDAAILGDAGLMQQRAGQWLQFSAGMALYLASVNPNISSDRATVHFHQQIICDIAQIQAYMNQDYASVIAYYDQARAIARGMAGFFIRTAP